ncbi:hypothetical protein HID58_025507 [Brassica napus]|uniref:Uncharacterized protein n=1 Tax=Brassica napus TaxID=3708 RepID=A0ABQ8CLB3_BRANA|nr:hypothetical protein HID58_025507 [Brassica napus]
MVIWEMKSQPLITCKSEINVFFFSSRGDERTYRRRRRRSILPPENVETPERDGRDYVGEKEASFERERKRLVLTVLTNSLEVAEPEEGAVDERLPSRLFYRMFLKGHKRWKNIDVNQNEFQTVAIWEMKSQPLITCKSEINVFFFSSRGDERTYRRRRRRSILPPENVETPERDGRDYVGEKEASFERERKRLVLTVLTNSLEVAEPEEGAVDERLPSRLFYRMFLKGHKRWKNIDVNQNEFQTVAIWEMKSQPLIAMHNQENRPGTMHFAEFETGGLRVECLRCHVPFRPHLGNLIAARFQCESCKASLCYRSSTGGTFLIDGFNSSNP